MTPDRSQRLGLEPGSDWFEWSGGECPVEPGKVADVMWNNGAFSKAALASMWSSKAPHSPTDFWQRPGHPYNETSSYIIAYRVVRP